MSTCTTERWIDRVDPYGHARQAGLKVSYVAIIFFLVNAFWKAPTLAVLTMCVTGAGIVLIEMPSINTPKKKDVSYIVFTLLTIITVSIFRFFSYFTVLELVAIVGWSYVLYRLIAKDTEKAQVVAIAILIGFVSLEAPGATDFWQWVNQTAFYVQFAVIAFVAHKLFPNRYLRIAHNILRQIWLLQQRQLIQAKAVACHCSNPAAPSSVPNPPTLLLSRTDMATAFIKHIGALEQVQALLPANARAQLPALVEALWQYQQIIDHAAWQGTPTQIDETLREHQALFKKLNTLKTNNNQSPPTKPPPADRETVRSSASGQLSDVWSDLCQRA